MITLLAFFHRTNPVSFMLTQKCCNYACSLSPENNHVHIRCLAVFMASFPFGITILWEEPCVHGIVIWGKNLPEESKQRIMCCEMSLPTWGRPQNSGRHFLVICVV